MKELHVYISSEDEVTSAIIERLLEYCSDSQQVYVVIKKMPARGGKIKSVIPNLNNLSQNNPVILLTDLDANACAPSLKTQLLNGIPQNNNFIMNIAVDEAEAWLMADREGFASFIGVPVEKIPNATMQKQQGMNARLEMNFPYKSSRYLTCSLINDSKKQEICRQLKPANGSVKGPEYNAAILPFIQKQWNISDAMANSDSLTRMINRLMVLKTRM